MNLTDVFNAVTGHKRKRRIGRGAGSGSGKTAGRGQKGLGSRTGANWLRGFVGGQTQLKERLPKVGFNNANYAKIYLPVNLDWLNENYADGEVVDAKTLCEKGFTVRRGDMVKVLGHGDLAKKLTVKTHAVSKTAQEKIEKAGGSVDLTPIAQKAGKVKERAAKE